MKLVQSYDGGWLETPLRVTARGSYNDYFLSVSERACAGYLIYSLLLFEVEFPQSAS